MSKKPRLHEVAKALGVTTKILMSELEKLGYEFKTHMAALDVDALKQLSTKYPDVVEKVQAAQKSNTQNASSKSASTTKAKSRSTRKKGSRMVTKRSQDREEREKEENKAVEKQGSVQILEQDQGVTVEQKVVRGGVLRRRRVQSAPPKSSAPAEDKTVTEPPKEREKPTQEKGAQPEAPPSKPSEAEPPKEQQPSKEAKGRNLSANRRLKIVSETSQSQEPTPTTTRRGMKQSETEEEILKKKELEDLSVEGAAAKKEAAKKKSPKKKAGEEPEKVTKKDLFGMTEEVEITRVPTRKTKRSAARVEKKAPKITTPGASKRKVKIDQEISVADLADRMGLKAADVVRKLVSMGQMVSAHQFLDFETASVVASEYGYETQDVSQTAENLLEAENKAAVAEESEADLVQRPPIVTIMGHVDHGKTSLLDYIRKSKITGGEAGGITQHIGAYQIEHNGKKVTFLDTPGHEAFSKMRSRGAGVTDLVILVVAADEGVKPQTLEALAHAKDSGAPILVAVNKIDKAEANPDRVMQELASHELVPESWGGETIYTNVSATTGQGVSDLLEMLLLQAELLELKANPSRSAQGVVVESRLDKGKGPVATVLVQTGTLKKGDSLVCGSVFGRVRAMVNETGEMFQQAGPSMPAEILGLEEVPELGESFQVVSEESTAKKASELAQQAKKAEEARKSSRVSLEEMYKKMQAGEMSELRVVLKGDVQGSVEAVADNIERIEHDKVKVKVIYKAVGGISESDISLAAASGALVVGFNVRPTGGAKKLAQQENIQIKNYTIIYELTEDIKMAMQGLLEPTVRENVLGQAEVRDVFSLSKAGTVAGCMVKSGKIQRNAKARLVRDSVVVYDAKITSLKRFKEDAKEVAEGYECGMKLEDYSDIKVGDVIECYETVEVRQAVS